MKGIKEENHRMDTPIKQAVIVAGGLGMRMRPFTEKHPKPMYLFQGKPFMEYLLLQLRSFGIEDVLILLGYLAEDIMEYFKDGKAWGIRISYDITPAVYNTGGRLLHAEPLIRSPFLFLYCDNFCPIDFLKLVKDYEYNRAMIQLSAYDNRDGYTKSNLLLDGGRVRVYDKTREAPELKGVDIGYAIVDKRAFAYMNHRDEKAYINFEAAVYPKAVQQGKCMRR